MSSTLSSTPATDCPVAGYARRIAGGQIPAAKWVKAAARRHLDDLEKGPDRGLTWDQAAADRACKFIGCLRQSKGRKWGGQLLTLQPWQVFIVGCLFGWKKADGTRRFRIGFVEIPRKNGKSTLAAAIALYLLVADGEPGAEVYSVATKRDQAKIVFGEARRMVGQSKPLLRRLKRYRDSLKLKKGGGEFKPVSSEAHTLDGLNPSGIIADEIHKWPSRELWDVLDTATEAREQPLILAITTAGDLDESIYSELHNYAESVLDGVGRDDGVTDDAFFAFVATIDEGDDPFAESSWAKANPNWGVTVQADSLRNKAKRMARTTAGANRFKRDHLCVRTASLYAWIPVDVWDRCKKEFTLADLKGRPCFGGLDMASTSDLAAFALVFPEYENGTKRYRVWVWFWCADTARDSVGERLREILRPWVQAGWIVESVGDCIDQREIEEFIINASKDLDIIEVAYDPHNMTQKAAELQERGVNMVDFGQSMANYNEPSKEFEAAVRSRRLEHAGNPVMRWMVGNCVAVEDGVGKIMPHRRKSRNKIDGIPATIMAIARAMQGEPKPVGGGVEVW